MNYSDNFPNYRKIANNFHEIFADTEVQESVLKSIANVRRAEKEIKEQEEFELQAECPLCGTCHGPVIRICKKHRIVLIKT